ncbi:YIP1 family protein [Vibrio sp. MACH09]|uniref:YIP1 family protein n=1 Tax=unclassified Vibrio TaxID=2614977 RepID=UPI001493BF6D|nr:YIP1 family protein [Vibrio sp. MACH09]NOI66620.1 YIP1 family protein [Vibrio sp. 99-8-1]
MIPSSNPLIMLLDIFRAPTSCFSALYQKGMWGWQIYILLLISPFLFWGAYFDVVDFEWLKAALISQTDQNIVTQLDANTLMASEIINDILNRTLVIGLLAFWFMLAAKPSKYQHGYWKWFAGASVVIFPAVLGDLASYVNLLVNHGQVMNYAADLNSLNGLLKLPLTSQWSGFASAFPLLLPWYIVLGYAAIGAWTEFTQRQALLIASIPWLGYFIIWALYILIF